jgi:predicted transposase YbfD/YdcC
MARLTLAQNIECENEQVAERFFETTLAHLPDPRRAQGTRYPLRTVVVTALMAMVCGCDDAESMEMWGETRAGWLATFLDMPHGAPTQDVYLSVFGALNSKAFSAVFRAWASLLTLRMPAFERHIAIDGKTSRGSEDDPRDRPAIHIVSAWLSEAGLVLGQCTVDGKSNEIAAIPELLRTLDLRDATVTIDAMGCQTEIAATIVDGGGHYLLSVKGNQPALKADLERTFAEAADMRLRSRDELPRPVTEQWEETDKGHGRIEHRKVTLCRDLSWMESAERWAHAALLLKVERQRTTINKGKSSSEVVFYLGSSKDLSAQRAGEWVRRHWSIESQLHWTLDMAFGEDLARHRTKNCAQNMTTLRHFALNIVKQDKSRRLGVANTRKHAGWDPNYLITLLTGASRV